MNSNNKTQAGRTVQFWKMSHGKGGHISNKDHEWLMENCYVTQGYKFDDTKGKSQGKRFHEIPNGDFFYLVRNSEILLLGRFVGTDVVNATDATPTIKNWFMRKFELVKRVVNPPFPSSRVPNADGWKPQGNTTIYPVPKDALPSFESLILKPAFNMSLHDLTDSQPQTVEPPNATSHALNRVLYGPPGTGKTYRSVTEALRIIEGVSEPEGSYQEQRQRFDALRRQGRIAFVTFHQSFSYEDFVEGIRAETSAGNIHYAVKDGIFKQMAIHALYNKIQWPATGALDFDTLYTAFLAEIQRLRPAEYPLTSARGHPLSITQSTEKGSLYVMHAGRGYRHFVSRENLAKLYAKYPDLNAFDAMPKVKAGLSAIIGKANPTAYWATLKGLLDFKRDNATRFTSGEHRKEEQDYARKKALILGESSFIYADGLPHVLIIDEINRGNTSRVFGELITLIESGKRIGDDEALEVTLPYSNETFGVPNNLYIIGTMNTADRSLSAIDTALRRRFDFIEMMPDPDELEGLSVDGVEIALMLQCINARIEYLYDREHMIGHAFFMGLTANSDIKELAGIFRNKILPLLEEYFFEDWEKISTVLGKAGIYTLKTPQGLGFAPTNKVYVRQDEKLENPETYIAIYETLITEARQADASTNA